MARLITRTAGWLIGLVVLVWRITCRYRVQNDPRPALRAQGRPYAYALLHAHQVAAVFCNDEERMAAMVSRSTDGDLLAPSLRLRRVLPVRGSTRKAGRDKGGKEALEGMKAQSRQGVPVLFAVDGPRGPRNRVQRGVATLAQSTGAVVLPTVVVPTRRHILARSWDRLQVPLPGATVALIFGDPIDPAELAAGPDGAERLRSAIEVSLTALEATHDPEEAPAP